jgi:hypothetical protein
LWRYNTILTDQYLEIMMNIKYHLEFNTNDFLKVEDNSLKANGKNSTYIDDNDIEGIRKKVEMRIPPFHLG